MPQTKNPASAPAANPACAAYARTVRTAALLTLAISATMLGFELTQGASAAVVGIRCGMVLTPLAALLALRHLPGHASRWILRLLGGVTVSLLGALTVFEPELPLVRLAAVAAAPAIAASLEPEDPNFTVFLGVLVSAIGGVLLASYGTPMNAVRWTLLVASITAFSYFAAVRYRRVRENLRDELQASMHRLTRTLSEAATDLFRLRDEHRIVESVVRLFERHRLASTFFRLEDGVLRFEATPPGPDLGLLDIRARLKDLELPRRSFEERRAILHNQVHAYLAYAVPAEALPRIRAKMPRRGVLAPVFVEEEPFGILSVQSDALTEAAASAIELFARYMGAAIGNVRQHRRAVERERLAALGEAAAVVAHEVRNPLGAIANATSLLKRSPQRPDTQELLGMIDEEAARLDGLVHDLLFVARPLEPRLRPVDLRDVCERVTRALGVHPGGSAAQLELEVCPKTPWVIADPSHLQLALQNLLRNAVQASPPGGTVRLCVTSADAHVWMTVDDEGPGIPDELVHRIFEPFFTTRVAGTGLGLSLVKRIADAHGASIRVERSPSGGTRFSLALRTAVEHAEAAHL